MKSKLINNKPPNLKSHKFNIFHTCALNNTISLLQAYYILNLIFNQNMYSLCGKVKFTSESDSVILAK